MKKIIALTLAAASASAMAATSFAFIGGNNTDGVVGQPGTSRPGSIEGAGTYALDFGRISGNTPIDMGSITKNIAEDAKLTLTDVLVNGYNNVEQIQNDGIQFHFNLVKNENNAIANVELKQDKNGKFFVEATLRNTFKTESKYEVELIIVNTKTGENVKSKFAGKVLYNEQMVNHNGNNMVFNAIPVYDFGKSYINNTNNVNFTFDSASGSYNFVQVSVVPTMDEGKKFLGYSQELPSAFVGKYDSSYKMQGFRLLDESLTFGLGATMTFDSAKLNATEAYLYELAADGSLKEIGRTTTGKIIVNEYSKIGGKQYILSNKVLGATTSTPSTPNTNSGTGTKPPANTGSSDIVNAAVALSVLSLAAAGAVVLRKTK
ncbi:MAG: hypothetical protein RSB96_04155 [Oscillospiraceae bacterium]